MKYGMNTRLLLCAMEFYISKGYVPTTVPFIVSQEAIASTKPEHAEFYPHDEYMFYVGSAEQSFVEMMINCDIGPGEYFAVTPCYRDEPYLDDYHLDVFLKLELIVVGRQVELAVLDHAVQFFRRYVGSKDALEVVKTDEGFDVMLNGVEIGSYGSREINGIVYTYGTGLAEPRFSTARKS